jgi:hypothetical protein
MNGKLVCEEETLIRQETSKQGVAIIQIIKNQMKR